MWLLDRVTQLWATPNDAFEGVHHKSPTSVAVIHNASLVTVTSRREHSSQRDAARITRRDFLSYS
jgi:hypothetical protein